MAVGTLVSLLGQSLDETWVRTILSSQGFVLDWLDRDEDGYDLGDQDCLVLLQERAGIVVLADDQGVIGRIEAICRPGEDSGISPYSDEIVKGLTPETPRVKVWLALGNPARTIMQGDSLELDVHPVGKLDFVFVYKIDDGETHLKQVIVEET